MGFPGGSDDKESICYAGDARETGMILGSQDPADPMFLKHQCQMGVWFEAFGRSLKKVKVLITQSCLTFCDPMDCSLSGSSVHGISQARILEHVAISYSRRSSQPRDQTPFSYISCISRQILYPLSHLGCPTCDLGPYVNNLSTVHHPAL